MLSANDTLTAYDILKLRTRSWEYVFYFPVVLILYLFCLIYFNLKTN